MGVDYFVCCICGETFNDCGPYKTCSKCEDYICPNCMQGQEEKHGYVTDPELISYYGEDALASCDGCDMKNLVTKKDKLYNFCIERQDKSNIVGTIHGIRKILRE